jgi:hypothetical protein
LRLRRFAKVQQVVVSPDSSPQLPSTISNYLFFQEALEAALKEVKSADGERAGDAAEEVKRLQQLVLTLETELAAKQENLLEDNFIQHDEPLVTAVTDVRVAAKINASKAPKKKRTFGKARASPEMPVDNDSTQGQPETKDGEEAALSALPLPPGRFAPTGPVPAPASALPPKKAAFVSASEVKEVLPEPAAPEALPKPVYANAGPALLPVEESKVASLVTGEGYIFRGRWTYPWLDLANVLANEMTATTPGPPPAVVAFRSDLGATELIRCY